MFFLLSAVFQTMAALSFGPLGGYAQMFQDSSVGDDESVDVLLHPQAKFAARIVDNARYEMRFNWLRFVEYSASGSLVLFTIALLLGITDVDLLVCIFMLAAACMLLGILAEVFQRAANCLAGIADVLQGCGNADALLCAGFVKGSLLWPFQACFWLAHILGWVCILVPWVIIFVRFASWFSPCGAESLQVGRQMLIGAGITQESELVLNTEALNRNKPPDFVIVSFLVRSLALHWQKGADTR